MNCEIEGCDRGSVGRTNGIHVCERCRIHFTSLGFGAVYFNSRWHGVRGANYTPEQVATHPGLRAKS